MDLNTADREGELDTGEINQGRAEQSRQEESCRTRHKKRKTYKIKQEAAKTRTIFFSQQGLWIILSKERNFAVEFFKCIFWHFELHKSSVFWFHYTGEKRDLQNYLDGQR